MKYLALSLAISIALCARRANSQTLTTLVQFTGSGGTASGWNPAASLIAIGGTLYGMTGRGGDIARGNIFSVGMDGTNYQNLVSFTGNGGTASGVYPWGSLIAVGGTLYGMTYGGGSNGWGNVFGVGTNGTNYQDLFSFTGPGTASGYGPWRNLIAIDGTLYGMASAGGVNNFGSIFSLGTNGTNFQNVHTFNGSAYPDGSLIASGGTLYGMTQGDGGSGVGTVFSVGTNGTNFQSLVSFNRSNGAFPFGSLIASGSTLFGMTWEGGANRDGNVFSIGTNGANFKNLLSFTGTGGAANGWLPNGSLILSGTSLYGMIEQGGVEGGGNIFSVGIDGSAYKDLYDFTGGADGGHPEGDLLLNGGTLFGMTYQGGNLSLTYDNGDIGAGTIFAFTLPTPTPEPGTLALVGCGAASLIAYRWRRRAPKGRRFTQRRASPW